MSSEEEWVTPKIPVVVNPIDEIVTNILKSKRHSEETDNNQVNDVRKITKHDDDVNAGSQKSNPINLC